MSPYPRWPTIYAMLGLATAINAELPFSPKPPLRTALKRTGEVTFDPLAVAAVLHNPRAEASAARLYAQRDRDVFRWPHTMMVGGTLTPVRVLVDHLTSNISSVHPAISMCLQDATKFEVRSDTVFRELPVNFSNLWLHDILAFKSSRLPGNDFMVVRVYNIFGVPRDVRSWPENMVLNFVGLLTGLILAVGVVFSVLLEDIWAVTLFVLYLFHWVASTFVSFNALVTLHEPDNPIFLDPTIRYAVYQRPGGGTVVFKAEQDVLETWARMTWQFDRTWPNLILHWSWIITGSLAALSSIACMVNMIGIMQLVFLGVLLYSSAAEILVTQVARRLQVKSRSFDLRAPVLNNRTRTQAIICATLEVDKECELKDLNWIELGLLPRKKVFENLLVCFQKLHAGEDLSRATDGLYEDISEEDRKLADRIAGEIREALANKKESGLKA